MTRQILRPKQVVEEYGLSRTTLWRLEKKEGFPRKIKISSRATGYLRSDLDAWLQSLKDQAANRNSDQDGQ